MSNESGDMHPADITAALKKRGLSLAAVARKAGYEYSGTLRQAYYRPWPKGERIIAAALGKEPKDIWPSRYPPMEEINIPHRTVA